MRINTGRVSSVRSAIFLTAVAVLIAFASVLLAVNMDFTITLGDLVGTPIATAEGTTKLERSASLALDLWHVALRAVGALFAGIVVSCLLAFLAYLTGFWPSPLEAFELALRAWILRVA